jgi:hypothetical protein
VRRCRRCRSVVLSRHIERRITVEMRVVVLDHVFERPEHSVQKREKHAANDDFGHNCPPESVAIPCAATATTLALPNPVRYWLRVHALAHSRLTQLSQRHGPTGRRADAFGRLVPNGPRLVRSLEDRAVSEPRRPLETRERTSALAPYPLNQPHTVVSKL